MNTDTRIAMLAYDLSSYDPNLSEELFSIANTMRKRWKKRSPQDRLKRRKWLKSPAGRKYQKNHHRVERKPSTKLKRQRSRNRGIHHKYPWLRTHH